MGIVGLPNVGKSSLFNLLGENANAAAENYPFCTIDPNEARLTRTKDKRLTCTHTLSTTAVLCQMPVISICAIFGNQHPYVFPFYIFLSFVFTHR